MICNDCEGEGDGCLLCDEQGSLCDICGEATGETGLDVCAACRGDDLED